MDISAQLSDILDNVNCAINRFQEELGYDLKERAKPHQPEQKGKKRFILLEKIASFSKDAKAKEKHLYEILRWLGEWGDSLTYEIKNRSSEEDEALDEWIEVMEKVLPLSLMATKGGIESLISLCSTLIEDQKKRAESASSLFSPIPNRWLCTLALQGLKVSKHNFWQNWHEKSPQKKEQRLLPEPPSPEQMLQDKNTTHSNVSEVRSMLQELLDSTMFNKGEVKAIRYMSAVVENLNKALILQHKENRSLETKYKYLQVEKNKELSTQRLHFQKSIQVLESKKDALLKQVKVLGDKYHNLLMIKHALEFQLKMVQTASGPEEPVKVFVHDLEPPEKETLPEVGKALEEKKQEPKEEGQVSSALSPSPLTKAWDSGTTPAARKPLSGMATDSRVRDVFIDRAEPLEPVLLHSDAPQIPTRWDKEGKDQGDHIHEEGVLSKSHSEKSLSPGSTRRMLFESHMGHWEEELNWETRRQQWQQEEEMWLQRQKKWALLEQEHQEKVRQWEAEAAARQQWQRLAQPEEEKQSPRREQKASSEKMIFTTTSRWKNLEKSESATVTPHCRAQSARQSRSSYILTSPHTQQPGHGIQRTLCEFMQTPRTRQVSAKPKKCTSFPITGTSVRRVSRASLQKAPGTPKDKVYHIDMEAQLKNLQILGGSESELALPQYLRSKALEVTALAMELSTLRLQYLCKKYIHYRRFQSLRQEVIKHIGVIRQTRVTYKAQNLYMFLENIDRLQSLRLQAWTDKQKGLEERHQECLHSMAAMFPKVIRFPARVEHLPEYPCAHLYKANEKQVIPSLTSESPLQPLRHQATSSAQAPGLRAPEDNRPTREPDGSHMEDRRGLFESPHREEDPYKPVLGTTRGVPRYPPAIGSRGAPLLPQKLNILQGSGLSLGKIAAEQCASSVQRKECQEPSEELAGLVRKMSSQSLPGSVQSQKDRVAPVPAPTLS
ncbi:Family with sequence similarity 186, member B [Apodemus speciosus]|uniref:Family with sequence similarity 186, member B n=1 Tax=Apodemus speciosus TaxID=105296 RepID=A0ABQ0FKS5_APOSI